MTFKTSTTAATLALSLAAAPMAFAQETGTQTMPMANQNQPAQNQPETGQGAQTGTAQTGLAQADSMNGTSMTGDATTGDTMTGDAATMQTAEFQQAELEAFARAVLAVAEVRDTYAVRFQAAEDETAQQSLLQEANTEMRGAVEETDGITVERYVAISEAALTDQVLSDRIATLIEAEQGDATGTEENDQG